MCVVIMSSDVLSFLTVHKIQFENNRSDEEVRARISDSFIHSVTTTSSSISLHKNDDRPRASHLDLATEVDFASSTTINNHCNRPYITPTY
jgi:hypothetical protein